MAAADAVFTFEATQLVFVQFGQATETFFVSPYDSVLSLKRQCVARFQALLPWPCGACAADNAHDRAQCEACSAPKPAAAAAAVYSASFPLSRVRLLYAGGALPSFASLLSCRVEKETTVQLSIAAVAAVANLPAVAAVPEAAPDANAVDPPAGVAAAPAVPADHPLAEPWRWRALPQLSCARVGHAAVVFMDHVFVVGGHTVAAPAGGGGGPSVSSLCEGIDVIEIGSWCAFCAESLF